MSILVILLIAISLSMDAFSLSLAYGTLNLNKREILKLSVLVGVFHFFMPLIGTFIGDKIINIFPFNPSFIVFIILSIIGIQMILETFREEKKVEFMNFIQLVIFGFAVSVDSFSVGISLEMINNNFVLCAIIFCLLAFIFTVLGLILGKKINKLIGKISELIGGIILIIIGLFYLLWF